MGLQETATAQAVTAIESLLSEPGRKALLRREVIAAGVTPGACERALRRLRAAGVIARLGQGIYAPADVKLVAALDEILERLGIETLPGGPAKGCIQYLRGNVVKTRRRVTRRLRQRGVQLYFETPEGEIMQRRPAVRSRAHEMPSKREIEEHFHSFLQCHSLARAEHVCAERLFGQDWWNLMTWQGCRDGARTASAERWHRPRPGLNERSESILLRRSVSSEPSRPLPPNLVRYSGRPACPGIRRPSANRAGCGSSRS